jgi:hypothetical protein
MFGLAFDALFQKPLLIVEHHEYFRSGYEPLAVFVREVNGLEPKLVWMPLLQTLSSSCLMREVAARRNEVRFVTPVFSFTNPTAERRSFVFRKPETSRRIAKCLWGGSDLAFESESGSLCFEAELDPGEQQRLEIVYEPPGQVVFSPSLKYRSRVLVRRLLSDLRDNYLSRSSLALSVSKTAAKLMSPKRSMQIKRGGSVRRSSSNAII